MYAGNKDKVQSQAAAGNTIGELDLSRFGDAWPKRCRCLCEGMQEFPHVPVIVMSGYVIEKSEVTALEG